ncbi:T9SS type A sorting domain-containing protein [candidate division WOR-3 bacterium]|nr:T9SS type A sorting domain-containing protein [candidate division WOR-3 bacterium]
MKRSMLVLCSMMIATGLFAGLQTHSQINNTTAPNQDLALPLATLWSQIPDSISGAGMSSQIDSVYPFESELVDDVENNSGSAWNIDSMTTWWSNWNGFSSWTLVPNIRVLVYEDSGIATPMPKMTPTQTIIVEAANYTAYGANPYSVHMNLTGLGMQIPVGRWWIVAQPSTSFAANGQTGWQCSVGIGNGQEWYQAFVLLGITKWTSASAQGYAGSEAGFILYGNPNAVEENPVQIPSLLQCRLVSAFSGKVAVELALPSSSDVSFRVMDVTGRTIGSKNLNAGAGTHTVSLDQNLSTGTYFYRLEASGSVFSGKIIVAE